MLNREPDSVRGDEASTEKIGVAVNSWNGRRQKHFPRMGTLLWIDALGCLDEADRREAPWSLRSATDGRIGLAEAGFTALMGVKTGTFSYGPKGYSG
jgi:hypothetical protein